MDDICVVFAEQDFGGGADAKALGQLFLSAMCYPGDFGGEACYVIFFFLEEAFGDKHRHIYVFVAGGFEAAVEFGLDVFPYCVAVGADDHAAADGGVFY